MKNSVSSGIIGLTDDIVKEDGTFEESLIEDAKDIVRDTGVTYPILISSKEVRDFAELEAYPTTYLVDANGKLLVDPIIGSHSKAEWEEIITNALSSVN